VIAALESTAQSIGPGLSVVDASGTLESLGVSMPPPVRVLAANGSLRLGARRTVIYRFTVPPGLLAVKLAYTSSGRLALSVRAKTGTLVGTAHGASPLELTAVVPGGPLVASVTGRAPASYHMSVSITVERSPAPEPR
jgi:hypothetical protein